MKTKVAVLTIVLALMFAVPHARAQSANVGYGAGALTLATGGYNTGFGFCSLTNCTSSTENTGFGFETLFSITTEGTDGNTAAGYYSMYSNTTGYRNAGNGMYTLYYNLGGYECTANGMYALERNTSGVGNTAEGYEALQASGAGFFNTADGYEALYQSAGSNNVALGAFSGSYLATGSNNVFIANNGDEPADGGGASRSGVIYIGFTNVNYKTYVAGIWGVTITGAQLYVDENGFLGNATSSARFKRNIRDMGRRSEEVLSLRPVSFEYKPEIDSKGVRQFGLVAEEVEKVDPDLVVRDKSGKPYGVRYEAVNSMLLNEFLKQHGEIEARDAELTAQKDEIARQVSALRELRAKASRIVELESKLESLEAKARALAANGPVVPN